MDLSRFAISVGTREPLKTYSDITKIDKKLASKFFNACMDNGYISIPILPSRLHTIKRLTKLSIESILQLRRLKENELLQDYK